MTESISQGIPQLALNDHGLSLYKCNDISFTNLKRAGFNCLGGKNKPDQIVAYGDRIIIGIEDKADSRDLATAVEDIKNKYLESLPETNYFIARAGDQTRILFRITHRRIVEIGTTKKGKEVICFGPRVITGENTTIQENLSLLSGQILASKEPINGSIEIQPPKDYYNPLIVKQNTIYSLWQKIFVSTGENAHTCLYTFVELLLYKGLSDAGTLPRDYSISSLMDPTNTNSLETYRNVVRSHIKSTIFPSTADQPTVINSFAFEEQETVFKTVLKDLNELGNIAQRQIDPDFKRRVIEAFLGSAHREGTIKSGKHLTPRIIIQAVWEMAEPEQDKRIIDPACGVGGFILEGFNYPYEYDPISFNCLGIDRDEQMIITAKANMVLHLLDYFSDPNTDNNNLVNKVHTTFFQARNNGTGTLGELLEIPSGSNEFKAKHTADYVFSNVPFYVNGVTQLDNSLDDIGKLSFYKSCGIGAESRFLRYILDQIKYGDPGIAFVIVTDGILYRHKDRIRQVINENADVLGIISLPKGCFQNNNWKTSIIIFKKKSSIPEYSPVFLYNVENIGVSLDAYRTPIEKNDIPSMKRAWEKRSSGEIDDPNCTLKAREEFLNTARWSDLFNWCREEKNDQNISFVEFIELAQNLNNEIDDLLRKSNRDLSDIFALEDYIEIKLGDEDYFKTRTAYYQTTVKHARLNPGDYPLYSSQVDGPVEFMYDPKKEPILIENERGENNKLISWNIKGDPGRDIRAHSEPFYVTENRGLIEIVRDDIDFSYVLYYLREHLVEMGDFSRLDEAHVGKVKRLHIRIPIDDRGNIDFAKQQSIANNYEQILVLRNKIDNITEQLEILSKRIDVFK